LDTLKEENSMLREYAKKAMEEVNELKEVLKLAEEN
jgi:hypothetical protein